jgi:hypothetical protein
LLIVAAALFQARLARKLSTEFQESKYIFQAILLIVLVIFIAVPVIFMARETPNASIFLGSTMIFVICMGILLLIFLPKMRFKQRRKPVVETSFVLGSNVHVSGVESDRDSRMDAPSMLTSTDLYPLDDGMASDDGERILTTKNRRELAEEVALLKKFLRAKGRREEARGASCDSVIGDVHGAGPPTFDASVVQKSDNSLDTTETRRNLKNLSSNKIRDVIPPTTCDAMTKGDL